MSDPTAARCQHTPHGEPCRAQPAPIVRTVNGRRLSVCPACFISLFADQLKATTNDQDTTDAHTS